MRDARRRPRDVVDHFLPVYHRETGILLGYLADVNVDGGMLETNEALEEGAFYPLRIVLSEAIDGVEQLELQARCVWNRKDRNAVFLHAGLAFADLPADTRVLLQQIADRFRLAPIR